MKENQKLIQRVVDDTRTLREPQTSGTSLASRAVRESTVGETVFDFDDSLVQTVPYQRVTKLPPRSMFGNLQPVHSQENLPTSEANDSSLLHPADNTSRLGSWYRPRSKDQSVEDLYGARRSNKTPALRMNPLFINGDLRHHLCWTVYPSRMRRSTRERKEPGIHDSEG